MKFWLCLLKITFVLLCFSHKFYEFSLMRKNGVKNDLNTFQNVPAPDLSSKGLIVFQFLAAKLKISVCKSVFLM